MNMPQVSSWRSVTLAAAAKTQMETVEKALAEVTADVASKANRVVGLPQQIKDYFGENRTTYVNRIRYA